MLWAVVNSEKQEISFKWRFETIKVVMLLKLSYLMSFKELKSLIVIFEIDRFFDIKNL